jgi:U3 small nucleolar RNA-associated protein 4
VTLKDTNQHLLITLPIQKSNHLHPKRIRDFASILIAQLPRSTSSSTGGLSFRFTPDSSKLVMSTVAAACILVIDLSSEKPHVLRRFDHHRRPHPVIQERVVKGRRGDVDGDVDMTDPAVDSTEEGPYQPPTSAIVNVLRMSISPDGQWLASSDDRSRTHVFNLDSIQVRPC